ncbi:hypothetical protein B0I72DRAFT_140355 [Yarrowia lipolytica]|uniref:Uncharacterized protein n=1 Tax=Yarrowia lipolytica TaxID=4952 RepID=A0A371BZX4_YARLL|nr:hypothetical protein BKA91DRAFT_138367 [Yarrowia lipolytica]KAE8173252.1 hypothetical protein BKA90DRAFT_136153 [Yarrowia lipolytica]RDW23637.1 hypothetical protein B0I71DRAFT_135646 [Yarrowia lipolytica]RDW31115.1 hypothetical protein B0I72DRAFT_140355 [Yarrowia lipolytica]RDW40088.1 hypothetical protein B0I73DRAFT_131038 [Yarrowia lipolytica]
MWSCIVTGTCTVATVCTYSTYSSVGYINSIDTVFTLGVCIGMMNTSCGYPVAAFSSNYC